VSGPAPVDGVLVATPATAAAFEEVAAAVVTDGELELPAEDVTAEEELDEDEPAEDEVDDEELDDEEVDDEEDVVEQMGPKDPSTTTVQVELLLDVCDDVLQIVRLVRVAGASLDMQASSPPVSVVATSLK
jgi:hypothetical protein